MKRKEMIEPIKIKCLKCGAVNNFLTEDELLEMIFENGEDSFYCWYCGHKYAKIVSESIPINDK